MVSAIVKRRGALSRIPGISDSRKKQQLGRRWTISDMHSPPERGDADELPQGSHPTALDGPWIRLPLEEYLEGSPWDGAEDIAASDLVEWFTDSVKIARDEGTTEGRLRLFDGREEKPKASAMASPGCGLPKGWGPKPRTKPGEQEVHGPQMAMLPRQLEEIDATTLWYASAAIADCSRDSPTDSGRPSAASTRLPGTNSILPGSSETCTPTIHAEDEGLFMTVLNTLWRPSSDVAEENVITTLS